HVGTVLKEQGPRGVELTGSAEEHVVGNASRLSTGGDERMRVVDAGVDHANLHVRERAELARGRINSQRGPYRVRLDQGNGDVHRGVVDPVRRHVLDARSVRKG